MQINLRNGCNLDCRFCWNHSPLTAARAAPWHRQRLSDAHLDGVVADLPRLHPGRVLLSGRGEPLLHPGVRRLLQGLRARAIPVTVQTNGVDGPSPEELSSLEVGRLLVNLSAASPHAYEVVHPGRGDLFGRVLARLEGLRRVRRSGGAPGVEVTLVGVINGDSASQILPLVELAARVGAAGVMLKGMELPPGRGRALHDLRLTSPQRDAVRESLVQAQARASVLGLRLRAAHLTRVLDSRGPGARTPDCEFTPTADTEPCYMGWYYLRVTIDGRVMFCCKDKPIDHLNRRSLYSIWRSAAYQLLRITGRDADAAGDLFDERCRSCSNFARNREIHEQVRAGLSRRVVRETTER